MMQGADSTSPEEIRTIADDIVSAPEFHQSASWFERLWGWIVDLFNASDPTPTDLATPPVAGGSSGYGIIPLLLLLLAVGLIVFILMRTRWSVLRRSRGDEEDDEIIVRTGESLNPKSLLSEAEQLERRGVWREALRLRYRALIADLISRGAVDDVVGRTTGEYRREIRASLPDKSDAFTRASDLFDDVWYGNKPTDAADSATFRALVEEVSG